MKKVSLPVLVALLACGSSMPVHAYLKFGVRVGADVIDVKWNRPIQYFITDRNGPGVTAVQLQDTVGRAFSTWQAVSTARIQSQFQALSIVPPGLQDGRTTIGFLDRPELDRVLGATTFLLDAASGEIIEAVFSESPVFQVLGSDEQRQLLDLLTRLVDAPEP